MRVFVKHVINIVVIWNVDNKTSKDYPDSKIIIENLIYKTAHQCIFSLLTHKYDF